MNETRKQALPVGTRIGVYEIRRVIGTGRFGITYQAWNQHLNSEMALKEYFPSDIAQRAADGLTVLTRSDSDERRYQLGLDRFSEDADKLARIEHTHLERVQNDLQIHGTIYLAMEYEDGIPLSRVVERSGAVLDEEQVKVIFLPIIEALGKVHEVGVVHGDINPENIMLRKSGESVLLDFASAKLALAPSLGIALKTYSEGYAAVEQFDPQGQTGPWTDLYSLGATMYRCVTGNDPLSATDRLSEVSQGKSDPQWPAVEAAVSGYHEDFLKAIDWMLAIRPEDRPQSVVPLLESLVAGSEEEAESDRDTSQKSDGKFVQSKPSAPRKGRPSVPLMIFAGLAGVLLIGTILWYSSRDRRGDEILAAAESQRLASLSRTQDTVEVSEAVPASDPGGAEIDLDTGTSADGPEKEAGSAASDSEVQDSGRLGGTGDPLYESSVTLSERDEAEDESLSPREEMTGLDAVLSEEKAGSSAMTIDPETELSSVDTTVDALGLREKVENGEEQVSAGTEPTPVENLPDSKPSSMIVSSQKIEEAEAIVSDGDSEFGPNSAADAAIAQEQDEAAALHHSQEESPTDPDAAISPSPTLVEDVAKSSVEDVVSPETSMVEGMETASDREETMISLPSTPERDEVVESGAWSESDRLQAPTQAAIALSNDESSDSQAEISAAVTESLQDELPSGGATETAEDLIANHMAAAEEHIAALRLSTPQGENALEHYQAVLSLNSDHSEAQGGVRRLVEVYVLLIDRAIEQDQLVAARVYLDRAEEILPEAPGLQRARLELSAAHPAGEGESTEGLE